MTTLYAIGGLLVVLLAAGYWLYRRGRSAQVGDSAVKSNKVKDEQLEEATRSRDPASVIDRLRNKGNF